MPRFFIFCELNFCEFDIHCVADNAVLTDIGVKNINLVIIMSKFPEAEARLFKNVFVCKVCKSKIKAPVLKVLSGRVKCRKCGASKLRPVRKK